MNLGPEDSRYVNEQDVVTTGDPIGKMGNQGAKDYHVHYEIKYLNKAFKPPKDILVDPNQFYDAPNAAWE